MRALQLFFWQRRREDSGATGHDDFRRAAQRLALAGLVLCLSAPSYAGPVECDVVIVGGGPGGVHTAYKLTTMHLSEGPVCLFEMSDHLGGRVGNNSKVGFDSKAFINNGVPVLNSGQTGTGGYRMYFNQYTYKLGQELAKLGQPGQLTFLAQKSFSRLSGIENPGFNPEFSDVTYFTYNNFGIAKYFAPLYFSPINDNDIWKVLLCGPQVPVDQNNFPQYKNMAVPGLESMSMAEYLQWVAGHVISPAHGPQVAQYLMDVFRFRSDFDEPIDAVGYLEFTAKDYLGGRTYYPIPSFQPYFDIMQSQITQNGGQIFLNEKVLSVNTQSTGPRYVVVTSKKTVTANTVIFATTHGALNPNGGITGNVTSMIVSQPEYQYVQDTNAVTLTQQFGDGKTPNSGWWHQDITYPAGSNLLGPQLSPSASPLRRSTNNFMIPGDNLPGCTSSGCNFSTRLFFNNTNELPLTDYHDFINVSRSIYQDKRDAVDNWIDLYTAGEVLSPGGGGNAAVNNQVLKSLRMMYPKVFTGNPNAEPEILATQFTVHKPAWYFLKQGALVNGITNDSLFAWSLNPIPGERVFMIGDAWRTDLAGWSEGAYKGSIHLLNKFFGTTIDPKEETTIKCVNGDIVDPS